MNWPAIALVLFAVAAHASASAKAPFWFWTGGASEVRALEIDLIRGNVAVMRRDGPVEIEVSRIALAGRADEVKIMGAEEDGVLRIRDLYPPLPTWRWHECLPPIDERGDFWRTSARFDVIVRVPRETRVIAQVKEGRMEGVE